MESATLSSCYADPNFAIICAFFEKFGKMCGVPFPMASELVGMLECENGVSPELASLHTQLLRKIRRSTTVEKWERTAIKFCQLHLKDDADELDKNGYLGCSLDVKLRLLRTLLESQFDYNPKFKAAVNLLTAEELRQKPIGKDLQGRLYWCHLDSGANMKVYREDPADEENGWAVVASDRITLVKLLHELTGDDTLDLSPVIEPPAPIMDTGQDSSGSEADEENGALSEGTSEEDDDDDEAPSLKPAEPEVEAEAKINGSSEDVPKMETEPPFECSEAIEEDVMYVNGVGSGAECNAGNPDRNPEESGEVSTSSARLADSSNDPRPSRREQPDNSQNYEPDSSETSRVDLPDSTVNPERVTEGVDNHQVADSSDVALYVADSTSENQAGSSSRSDHSRSEEPDSSRPAEPAPSAQTAEESSLNSSSDARPTDRNLRLWSINDICRSSEPEASTSSNDVTAENEAAACSSQRPHAWTNSTGNVLPVPEIRVTPNTPERDRLPSPSSEPGVDPAPIQPSKVEEDESVVEQAVENDSRVEEEVMEEETKTPSPSNVENNNNNVENQAEPAEPIPEIQAGESVDPGSQAVETVDPGSQVVETVDPGSEAVESVDPGPQAVETVNPGSQAVESVDPGSQAVERVDPGSQAVESVDTGSPAVERVDPGSQAVESVDKGSPAVKTVDPGSQAENDIKIVQENETVSEIEPPAEPPVPEKQTDAEKVENSVLSNSCESDNEVKMETNDSPTPDNENTTSLVIDENSPKEEKPAPDPQENAIKTESESQPEIPNVPDTNAEKMDVVENELEPSISESKTEDDATTCNAPENDEEIKPIKNSDKPELSTDEKPNDSEKPEKPLPAIKTDDDPLSLSEDAPKVKSKKKKKRKLFQKKDADDSADVKAEDKDSGTDNESPMKKEKRGSNYIPAREVQLLGVHEALLQEDGQPTVRQSRRIAQLRLKEDAERRRLEEIELENYKKRKNGGKKKAKQAEAPDDDDPDESDVDDDEDEKAHRRKEKKYKKFDAKNPWLNSTDSSSQEEEEEDEIEEEQEEVIVRSDHEFSPESDIEDPDYQPIRRARTAHARKEEPGPYDDVSCECCSKSDRPEWILLCDKCDKGSHADCLQPPLHFIPEGEWFCPPCSLETLITGLKQTLRTFDRFERQRENEALRKKRLAFVGISLDNVLPTKKKDKDKKPKPRNNATSSEESESESVSSGSRSVYSSESEPVYQLRERRSNVASYRYNEYDELIRSAIRQEEGEPLVVKADVDGTLAPCGEDGQPVKVDQTRVAAEEEDEESDEVPAVVPRKRQNKRKKKLTSLELSSEDDDHNSDSDFKGSSAFDDEDEDFSETDLSDERKWRRGANNSIRRSERARRRRKDRDFINDDSTEVSESEAEGSDSSNSDSDRSWRRKKKKKAPQKRRLPTLSNKRKKKRRKLKGSDESDYEVRSRKRKSKQIESDSDGNIVNRRTRGKQIKFVDDASDSEESYSKKKKKGSSEESDEEFDADEVKEEEDDVGESEDESDDAKPAKENDKPVQKLGNQLKAKKLKELDSDDEDMDGLDEEDEKKLIGMLDDSEMAVDELKAVVKRAKPVKTEEKHRAKVIITPTRAEIAERIAMKAGDGILLQSLQATPNAAATIVPETAVLSVAQPFPIPGQVFQTQPVLQPISLQGLNSHIAISSSAPPQLVQHHLQIPVPQPGHQLLQQPQIIPQLLSSVHQVVPTMTHPLGVSFAQQVPPMTMAVIQPQIHQTAIIAQPGMAISQIAAQPATPLTQLPPAHLVGANTHLAAKSFPPGSFPVQNYPNPSLSPTMQLSPDAKQRKKPGPKPGSKNKKKDDDSPGSGAVKARPRARNGEDVTIATVQAPTQFPDGAAVESGSVITRMLNSSHGALPVTEPGSHFPAPPVTTVPPLYQAARPLDPSPSGGAALSVAKSHFPPEGFSPYPNFQQHFAAFPSSTFPPAETPLVPVGPPGPAPTLVPGGKAFDEEETGEFGGLASYFASQAEEDMDT